MFHFSNRIWTRGSHMWTSPWSFLSSASMDLGLVSFFCHLTPAQNISHIFYASLSNCVILAQLECLWLSLLTSSCKPGVLLLTWSVGPSTGSACSSWGCCSATLWWDVCCVSSYLKWPRYIQSAIFMSHRNLISCVSSQDGLGQFCFLIFVAYSVFSAAFLIFFVPETKGKTMVEIMEDFNTLNYKSRSADAERTEIDLATKF